MKDRRARWIWLPTAILAAVQLMILAGVLLPRWSVGIRLNSFADTTVTAVRPGMPAERAGLRAGDKIELDESSRALLRGMASGTLEERKSYTISVRRGAKLVAPLTIVPGVYAATTFYPSIELWDYAVSTATFIVDVLIAAWLFALRPGRMTLALYLAMSASIWYEQFGLREFPGSVRLHIEAVLGAVRMCGYFALLVFALRFPFDQLKGRGVLAQRSVLLLMTLFSILAFVDMDIIGAAFNPLISETLHFVGSWGAILALTLALLILGSKLRSVEAPARARIRWGLVGVTAAILPAVLTGTASVVYGDSWLSGPFGVCVIIVDTLSVALPLSVAYVLTRSKFVDPRFTINRAAVLSVTGVLLVLAVAAVDWLSSRLLAQRGASDALDGAFAIGLGFFVNSIHRRIESVVERILFRSKYRAESRLREIGEALRFATSEEIVFDALVFESVGQLHLASAALFIRDEPGFKRHCARGWGDDAASHLDDNDQLVRMMRAHRSCVVLEDWRVKGEALPSGLQRPRIALPVFRDEQIVGVVFYADHSDHTKLDPSEVEMLQNLAERCSAALDRIEFARLRRRLMEIRHVHMDAATNLSPKEA